MAKKLKKFEFRTNGSNIRYPWDKWTDGSIWQLTAGGDFTTTPKTFRTAVYAHAKSIGKRARVNIDGDTVTLQFYEAE